MAQQKDNTKPDAKKAKDNEDKAQGTPEANAEGKPEANAEGTEATSNLPATTDTPPKDHNNPPEIIEAEEKVTFDEYTVDAANKNAVRSFVESSVFLWRKGRRAIHLAASLAIYHAQQYGDPCHLQFLHDELDEKTEKNLRAGLRGWCKAIATVAEEPIKMEDGSEIVGAERVWLSFKDDTFKVKSKSESYRKNAMSLQDIIDTAPFYQKLEKDQPDFNFISLLKALKAMEGRADGQAEKAGLDKLPAAYRKPLAMLAAMAAQDLEAIEVGHQPYTEILEQRKA